MDRDDSKPGQIPCLKGLVVQPAARRLLEQIKRGKISEADIDRHLDDDDRQILDHNVAASLWYPVESYERLVLLLRQAEGGVGADYWIRFGRENGADHLESAAVQIFLKAARGFGPRAGIALIKLSKLFYNFGEWSFEGDNLEDFRVVVTGAEPLSEALRFGTLGFLMHLVEQFVGHEVPIVSERPSPDVIVYRTR